MSGIIPPSIVTYTVPFSTSSDKFMTVSFPFRVQIEQIWFSTNQYIFNGYDGDVFDSERVLKLAAWKTKNTKTQHGQYDNPSDNAAFFGADPAKPYFITPDESLKPTLWLGNQDDRPAGQQAQNVGVIGGWLQSFRSTVGTPITQDDPKNVGWGNSSWSEEEWAARTYKTDVSVMNVDEMLSIFIYQSDGNWDNYSNDSAEITIHISYTGMWAPEIQSAPTPLWNEWWND